MNNDFQDLIDRYRARMRLLRETFDKQGYLLAVSARDPSYSIILTRNASSDAPWRVTSLRDRDPIGHREYDKLEGGAPTQNALAEFAGQDMTLTPRGSLPGRRAAPGLA